MFDLKKKVSPAISVGFLLGAFFITGFLHLMNKTTEKAQEFWYYTAQADIDLPSGN